METDSGYQRYRIEKKYTPNQFHYPPPFKVKINRWELLKLLVREIFHYKGNFKVISSRPCIYGVFSGPLGGFAPKEKLCVGCLRCTTQYPKIAKILPNPKRNRLGNIYVTPYQIDTIMYEAERGSLAVKGAGYRGKFGGEGWDGMWTDMSEIVRPTRDGIYGREYISTEITLGKRPSFLRFDADRKPVGELPHTRPIPFPMLFDTLPEVPEMVPILAESAKQLQTYAILPLDLIEKFSLKGRHIIPSLTLVQWTRYKERKEVPELLELLEWNQDVAKEIKTHFPQTLLIFRTDIHADLFPYYNAGCHVFHLVGDKEAMRKAHLEFVKHKCRDAVTLIGSGSITVAEHVPKAILLGLDAAALSLPLFIALQGKIVDQNRFSLPKNISLKWGVQRLNNLMGAWQDQIFEFAGAMGIREVRRMRGEIGRVLFQKDLEKEAFSGIDGYDR